MISGLHNAMWMNSHRIDRRQPKRGSDQKVLAYSRSSWTGSHMQMWLYVWNLPWIKVSSIPHGEAQFSFVQSLLLSWVLKPNESLRTRDPIDLRCPPTDGGRPANFDAVYICHGLFLVFLWRGRFVCLFGRRILFNHWTKRVVSTRLTT